MFNKQSNFKAKHLHDTQIREKCTRCALGGVGFGIEILISTLPSSNAFSNRWYNDSSINCPTLLLDQLKKERAGNCTHCDMLHSIFFLVSALSWWLRCQGHRLTPCKVQHLGSSKKSNASAFSLQCLLRTVWPVFECNAKMRCSTICWWAWWYRLVPQQGTFPLLLPCKGKGSVCQLHLAQSLGEHCHRLRKLLKASQVLLVMLSILVCHGAKPRRLVCPLLCPDKFKSN